MLSLGHPAEQCCPGHMFFGSEEANFEDGLIISDRIHLLQCTTTFDGFPSLNPRLLRADIQIKGTGVASTLLRRVHAPVEQSDNNHATA